MAERPDLLYLVHRIPYPPRKGDKVRSYHFLRELREHYRVHLGTFIDDPEDLQYRDSVRELCESVSIHRLRPKVARVLSSRGFLTGAPLSVAYFASQSLARWVDSTVSQRRIQRALVFSSSMGQYLLPHLGPQMRSVIDFVDVDSEKWRNYAALNSGPMSWVYGREGRLLLAQERNLARRFNASAFVTREEADLFRGLAPESAQRVHAVNNGVDARYFDPNLDHENPYPEGGPVLVFTGAMDYHANADAVTWFCEEVFSSIREHVPGVRFYVVGSNPVSSVRALAAREGVEVTGSVPDVRPYLAHANLSIAPLRVARGVQNKVLEAMAMARPVVGTRAAVEGIEPGHGLDAWLADDPKDFSDCVQQALNTGADGESLRQFVLERYDWSASAAGMIRLLEQEDA